MTSNFIFLLCAITLFGAAGAFLLSKLHLSAIRQLHQRIENPMLRELVKWPLTLLIMAAVFGPYVISLNVMPADAYSPPLPLGGGAISDWRWWLSISPLSSFFVWFFIFVRAASNGAFKDGVTP